MKRIVRSIVCVMVMCLLPLATFAQRQQDEAVVQLQKLNRFYRYLNSMYVDSVKMTPMVETAIRGMLAELDPHSAYLDAEEMKAARETTQGEFSGIGIEYNIHNDSIIVVNTVAQGPAERVGLRANDRIVEIDGENVVGIERNDVPPKLRGERGSTVRIGVARHGVEEVLHFTIVRDNIPINTIDAAFVAGEGIGYVKVNRFGNTTMREFNEAVKSLGPIDALILDLCGNGGGLLDQAVDLAGYFLPPRSVVTSIEGRAILTERLFSDKGGLFDGRVVVLIDESSASGSELVAGALQDWDRAVIAGRDSYGKGLVQREMPLGDGSAIRLTVARYHTPSGRVIQRPYEPGQKEDYYRAHTARLLGEKESLQKELPAYKTLRTKRTVYGGGGIQPDIIVEGDTTNVSNYMVKLVAQGVENEFLMDYMDRNRDRLKEQYPTFDSFIEGFAITEKDMEALVALATSKGVEYDDQGLRRSYALLRDRLTAMVAQRLYTQTEFYRVMNPRHNQYFIKAMEILNNWDKMGEPTLSPTTTP